MFTKNEYKTLTDEFTSKIKKELGDSIVGLIHVGSVPANQHIPGESDSNFVLIIKSKDDAANFELFQKIAKVQRHFINDPLFSSMFDMHVYFENELPTATNGSNFNWVYARSIKHGKTLIGTNPFENLEIPDELVKESAKTMVREHMESFKDLLLLSTEEDELDTVFMAVDLILRCATSYLATKGYFDIPKAMTPDVFEEKLKGQFDPAILHRAHRLRLGSKEETSEGFVEKAFAFCHKLVQSL